MQEEEKRLRSIQMKAEEIITHYRTLFLPLVG